MRIDSIKQWQWMIFSLLVGLAIGCLRQQVADDLANLYGSEIAGQARFERSLVTLEQGRPCFTDLKVHTQSLPDRTGASRPVTIVSGLYFDGHYEPADGKLLARWLPAFYVASIPYKPATDLTRQPDSKAAARFAAVTNPTVTDFMDSFNVRYSRAWWQGFRLWHWPALSFLTIGVLWPLALNLLLFGSLRRPPEEKGTDLSPIKLPETEPVKPTISEEEIAQLASLTADLEEKLGGGDSRQHVSTESPVPAPLQLLETSAVTSHAPPDHSDVNYGAKPDDFYPTAKSKKPDVKK